jgi:regulatory protein
MKVTAIEKQQKRQNRYSIFIDGKYSLSLSDIGLLDSKLGLGQELTEEEFGELKKKVQEDGFYSKVLNYISIRPRSTWEVETYLRLKKCPPPLSSELLNKLSNNGLLNDLSFAKSWVENRRLLKPVSRRRLISELRAKRVPTYNIDEVIDVDSTNDQEVLKELVERKRQQSKYQDKLKLIKTVLSEY